MRAVAVIVVALCRRAGTCSRAPKASTAGRDPARKFGVRQKNACIDHGHQNSGARRIPRRGRGRGRGRTPCPLNSGSRPNIAEIAVIHQPGLFDIAICGLAGGNTINPLSGQHFIRLRHQGGCTDANEQQCDANGTGHEETPGSRRGGPALNPDHAAPRPNTGFSQLKLVDSKSRRCGVNGS